MSSTNRLYAKFNILLRCFVGSLCLGCGAIFVWIVVGVFDVQNRILINAFLGIIAFSILAFIASGTALCFIGMFCRYKNIEFIKSKSVKSRTNVWLGTIDPVFSANTNAMLWVGMALTVTVCLNTPTGLVGELMLLLGVLCLVAGLFMARSDRKRKLAGSLNGGDELSASTDEPNGDATGVDDQNTVKSQTPSREDSEPAENPGASRMGCGKKIVLTVVASILLMAVALWTGWVSVILKTRDPERIRDIRTAIVQMEIPDGMKPRFGNDLRIPGLGFSMAFLEDKRHGGVMWFVAYHGESYDADIRIEDAIQAIHSQQNGPAHRTMIGFQSLQEKEVIEKNVNGKVGRFLVGKGQEQSTEYVQVTGVFSTRSGKFGVLNLIIPTEHMTMAAGRKLVETIQ